MFKYICFRDRDSIYDGYYLQNLLCFKTNDMSFFYIFLPVSFICNKSFAFRLSKALIFRTDHIRLLWKLSTFSHKKRIIVSSVWYFVKDIWSRGNKAKVRWIVSNQTIIDSLHNKTFAVGSKLFWKRFPSLKTSRYQSLQFRRVSLNI